MPPETLNNAVGAWVGQHDTMPAPVAIDGNDLRGASKQITDKRRMMVAAVEHDIGMVPGEVEVDRKSNEILAVRELSGGLDLAGRIVTIDAMHARQETARCLLGRSRADHVLSGIKDNQKTILDDLMAIDFSNVPWHQTVDKSHGRIERRRFAAVDISGAEWGGHANLHGRRQAICIERKREVLETGKRIIEMTWSLTSPARTGPELFALIRNHWYIENRLHRVRDVTCDEDRRRFRYLPEGNRHHAARAQETLDIILNPPDT